MDATDLMTDKVYFVSPEESVARVKNLFLKHKISSVLVMKDDEPVGLVGESDLADAFFQAREPIDEVRVKKVMRKGIVKVTPEATPKEISKELLEKKVKSAIVFDEQVLGIVTKTDLLDYFINNFQGRVMVHEVMDKNIRKVKPMHSLFHAIRLMQEEGISRVLVEDNTLQGIISLKDVAFASPGTHPTKRILKSEKTGDREVHILPFTVQDVMKTEVKTISSKDSAANAAKIMLKEKIGSLVVTNQDNQIEGIITKTDITKYLSKTD